jgi:drug/metabolite transporter (DMT)-like permease
VLLALAFFGERITKAESAGIGGVILGALVVSYSPGAIEAGLFGVLMVAGAYMAWGIDNNLTRLLSRRDPVRLVQIKTLGAGTGTLAIAAVIDPGFREVPVTVALLVGFLCFAVSIVFDVLALCYLGAAREAAFFATAPFLGAIAAVPLLAESLTGFHMAGGALLAAGVALLTAAQSVEKVK